MISKNYQQTILKIKQFQDQLVIFKMYCSWFKRTYNSIFIINKLKKIIIMKSTYTSVNGFLNPKKLITKDKKVYTANSTASQKNINKTTFNTLSNNNMNKQDEIFNRSQIMNYTERRDHSHQKESLNDSRQNIYKRNFRDESDNLSVEKSNTPAKGDFIKVQNIFPPSNSKEVSQFLEDHKVTQDKRNLLGISNQGIKNLNSNFVESKNESKQILQRLNIKIVEQMTNINKILEQHNRKLKKIIDVQYSKLKEAILSAVQEIFKESQAEAKKNLFLQDEQLNKQIAQGKLELEKLYKKFQKMKEGLDTSSWKKVTGEMLTQDYQTQIQNKLSSLNRKITQISEVSIEVSRQKMIKFSESLNDLLQLKLRVNRNQ